MAVLDVKVCLFGKRKNKGKFLWGDVNWYVLRAGLNGGGRGANWAD